MIYFSCPGCQRIGQAPDEMAGRQAACPGCGQQMLVPHFVLTGQPPAQTTTPAPTPNADGFVRFFCPHCRRKLKVPRSAASSVINCKRCGWRIEVASAVQESPAAPPRGPAPPGSESVVSYLPDLIPEPGGHYYYIKHGQRYGPVTGQALRQMATNGQLLPTDWVWKPGFGKWKHANKAKGLFPPAVPPAHTPPPDPQPVRPPAPPAPPVARPPASAAVNAATPRPAPAPVLPKQRPSAIPPESPAPPVAAPSAAAAVHHTPAPSPTGYSELIRSDPFNAPAFVQRGMSRAAQDDHDRAIGDLDAALRLDPQNAQALAARGLIYAKSKGNYVRGLADLSAAIRFAPRESTLYDLRAVLYHELGDLAQAQADERKAAELRIEWRETRGLGGSG